MVKEVKERRSTKGRFLSVQLTKTNVKLVKVQFPVWYRREKKRDNLPDEMNEEVLRNFFDFLGDKEERFIDVPDEYFDIKKNEGTRWIYGYLKKNLISSEEKPAANNPKASVTRRGTVGRTATGKSDDDQIKDAPPPVKVEAIGQVHLGDEKVMPYRKTIHTETSFDANDPFEDSFSGVSSEEPNKLTYDVEAHKKLIKGLITGLLDG